MGGGSAKKRLRGCNYSCIVITAVITVIQNPVFQLPVIGKGRLLIRALPPPNEQSVAELPSNMPRAPRKAATDALSRPGQASTPDLGSDDDGETESDDGEEVREDQQPATEPLTEYELQRQRNIAANQSVLESLGLAGTTPLGAAASSSSQRVQKTPQATAAAAAAKAAKAVSCKQPRRGVNADPDHDPDALSAHPIFCSWRPKESLLALQQAQAEGLVLCVAENGSGYYGVHLAKPGQPKPYKARVTRGGKQVCLGSFATAEEAALCFARATVGRAATAAPLTGEEGGTPPHPPYALCLHTYCHSGSAYLLCHRRRRLLWCRRLYLLCTGGACLPRYRWRLLTNVWYRRRPPSMVSAPASARGLHEREGAWRELCCSTSAAPAPAPAQHGRVGWMLRPYV